MSSTQELQEWGQGLTPESLTIDVDSYTDELEQVYEDNQNPSVMRFSYGDLDEFIRRSNYIGHSIIIHYARIERLLAKSKRIANHRKATLLKAFTDKCLASIPGKVKADGKPTADKAPVGVSKYNQEYMSFSYLSDQQWNDMENEVERLQELFRIIENQKKLFEDRLFKSSKLLDERKKLT